MASGSLLNSDDEFFVVKEVADLLRVHPITVYLMLKKKNGMPRKRVGKSWRIPKGPFLEWAGIKKDSANV